jgi:hypothetical protein
MGSFCCCQPLTLLQIASSKSPVESTGSDFQSVYATLEQAGIPAHMVNAPHVKNVPGRKTNISDSEWLAQLGRFDLVKPSFIPPQDLGQPRHPLPGVRNRQCRQHPARQVPKPGAPQRPQEGHHRRGP